MAGVKAVTELNSRMIEDKDLEGSEMIMETRKVKRKSKGYR